jgi:hypothetical protein
MKPRVIVRHPNDRANFTEVRIGTDDNGVGFYISYDTVVAYWTDEEGVVASENVWSTTTGKHLNYIEEDHKKRIPYDQFLGRLERVYQRISISY